MYMVIEEGEEKRIGELEIRDWRLIYGMSYKLRVKPCFPVYVFPCLPFYLFPYLLVSMVMAETLLS